MEFVPQIFSVMSWNVHKETSAEEFDKYVNVIGDKYEFLFFQEAHFQRDQALLLPGFTYHAAANLAVGDKYYGVLSASKIKAQKVAAYLSKNKEAYIGPHKSLIVSAYDFRDRERLLVLNVHAINFRENRAYLAEIERLIEILRIHNGPMLVVGDFNAWNQKRTNEVQKLMQRLQLVSVPFLQQDNIKSFMGNRLDFIMYRGVTLMDHTVDSHQTISDHNPLFARFRYDSDDLILL